MRQKTICLTIASLALVGLAANKPIVATITASGPVKVDGKEIPATGSRGVPLQEKVWLDTGESTAVMTFPETGRIFTNKNSKLKTWLEKPVTPEQAQKAGTARLGLRGLCLMEGAIRFDANKDTEMRICARGQTIRPALGSEGTVSISEADKKVYAHADKGSLTADSSSDCGCGVTAAGIFTYGGTAGAISKAAAVGLVGGMVAARGSSDKATPISAPVQ